MLVGLNKKASQKCEALKRWVEYAPSARGNPLPNIINKKASQKCEALKTMGGIWGSNPRPPEPQSGALTN